MYSVVLPALALTAVVMMVIAGFDPVLYEKLTINGHQLLRYGISALFLQQIWTFCVVPGMLGPIWSLGYEFWYYVLLGVWTFVPGKGLKWSLLAVISVLIGPKVMLLLGAWLAGVFAHRLCSGRRPAAFHKFIFWITLLVTAAGLAFSANLPLWNEELGQAPLYYSANWRVDLLFSPVFALNLWSGFLTLRSNAEPARGFRPIERFIRYSAGISFSVYLYHAPLFYLFAIFISPPGDVFGELVLLFAVLAVVMILARYTEQKLGIYRKQWHENDLPLHQGTPMSFVEENHRHNFDLWHEEDIARRDDIPAERIKQAKRNIDHYNQQRNNAMEKIDDWILSELKQRGITCNEGLLHSETPGMMIDRLSIMALKNYHMDEQVQRDDASPEHREKCEVKVKVLIEQQADLTASLKSLLADVFSGQRRFKENFGVIVPAKMLRFAEYVFGTRLLVSAEPDDRAVEFSTLGVRDLARKALAGRRFATPYARAVIRDRGADSFKQRVNAGLYSFSSRLGAIQVPPWEAIDEYQGYLEVTSLNAFRKISPEEFYRQISDDFPELRRRLNSAELPVSTELEYPEDLPEKTMVFPTGTSRQFMPAWWAKKHMRDAYFGFFFKDPDIVPFTEAGLKTGPYLARAVDSALAQDADLVREVIVCDDASTDETPELMRGYSGNERVRYCRHPENLGISGNTTFALKQAGGELIIRLDSDDFLMPDYARLLAAEFSEYDRLGVGHAAVREVDEDENERRIRRLRRSGGYQDGADAFRETHQGYKVAANICMFRKAALEECGYYREGMNFAEDWDLWARLADAGWGNFYMDRILANYRVWSDAAGYRRGRKVSELKGILQVFEETIEPGYVRRGWDTDCLRRTRAALAKSHVRALADIPAGSEDHAKVSELLRKLGDSRSVAIRMQLVALGLGPAMNTIADLELALDRHGMLEKFVTTLGFGADSRLLGLAPPGVRRNLARRSYDIPSSSILRHPFRELGRMILPKLGMEGLTAHETGSFSVDAVYRELDGYFSGRMADFQKAGEKNFVYAYEDGALATFRRAKRHGAICVYDLPIAYWETGRALMEEEAVRLPEWAKTLGGGIRDSAEKLARKTEELELADIIVGPGSFVMDSLPEWAAEKRRIVSPFGSPESPDPAVIEEAEAGREKRRRAGEKLRVLFVGSMGQRKGLGDLFAAVNRLERDDVELVVMGSLQEEMSFYRQQCPGFTHEAGRPHADVLKLMRSCDVFCLPSIVEGRALVMQEAMSQGLPVVITANTGGEDLVVEGETGFLVPIRSPESIAGKIAWFADNRDEIPRMSIRAREHAGKYSWSSYGDAVAGGIASESEVFG
eukprot:g3766.t1